MDSEFLYKTEITKIHSNDVNRFTNGRTKQNNSFLDWKFESNNDFKKSPWRISNAY